MKRKTSSFSTPYHPSVRCTKVHGNEPTLHTRKGWSSTLFLQRVLSEGDLDIIRRSNQNVESPEMVSTFLIL